MVVLVPADAVEVGAGDREGDVLAHRAGPAGTSGVTARSSCPGRVGDVKPEPMGLSWVISDALAPALCISWSPRAAQIPVLCVGCCLLSIPVLALWRSALIRVLYLFVSQFPLAVPPLQGVPRGAERQQLLCKRGGLK